MIVSPDTRSKSLFFLSSLAGDLLVCYHPPVKPVPGHADVIVIPPFAEEMNKSRRMFSILAQSLSDRGIGTLILDLYGTGDSQGDFSDARWNIWRHDVTQAMNWLRQQGASKVHLLCARLGALLAMDVQSKSDTQFDGLTFWAPIVNGQLAMTQFLRLRLAASLMESNGQKETTKDLRAMFEAGKSVEVAGYEISPELFLDINVLRLESMLTMDIPSVYWIEVVAEEGRNVQPASRKVIDNWIEKGLHVQWDCVVGEPFWSMQEITVVPAIIDKTVQHLVG